MPEHPHVKLGKHVDPGLPVYPQPPMRITKRLGRLKDAFAGIGSDDDVKAEFLNKLDNRVYYFFETFIPNISDRMPEYEFWGFESRAAFDADEFDEDRDGKDAATFPQWLEALDVIVDVNGGKRFLSLLKAVVPEEWLKVMIAETAEGFREALSGSPSLPSGNGASLPSGSGATSPTEGDSDTAGDPLANGSRTPALSGSHQQT